MEQPTVGQYIFNNIDLVNTLASARFFERNNFEDFIDDFNAANLTVVESLRGVKTAFMDLTTQGVRGRTLFRRDKRWPQAIDPVDDVIYFTTADKTISRIFSLISGALDDRTPSATREQANVNANTVRNNNNPNNNAAPEDDGRGTQNAFKNLVELRVTLNAIINDKKHHWNRRLAELRMSAVWVEGAVQQQGVQQQQQAQGQQQQVQAAQQQQQQGGQPGGEQGGAGGGGQGGAGGAGL